MMPPGVKFVGLTNGRIQEVGPIRIRICDLRLEIVRSRCGVLEELKDEDAVFVPGLDWPR